MIDWENRWQAGQTGWDLRQASPPLTEFAAQIAPEKRNLAILVPGCGNGYEVIFLLENGFSNVTMLDIAPTAIENMRARLDAHSPNWQQSVRLVSGDFFRHEGQYDLILEQTFFCALDPVLRGDYAAKMFELLKPGGSLAGVLFDRDFPGGPPFGGSAAEYRALFEPYFQIEILEKCRNSVAPRAGTEVFFHLTKRLPTSRLDQ